MSPGNRETEPAGRSWVAVVAAGCLVLAAMAGLACGPEETTGPAVVSSEPTDATYETRGKIVELPASGTPEGVGPGPSGALRIRHEAIPEFTTDQGEVTGMASMTMPFPVAPEVEMAGLAEGDVVAFTFVVRWDGSPPYQITHLEKLPPDTELEFGIPGEIDAPVPTGEPPVEMPVPPRP